MFIIIIVVVIIIFTNIKSVAFINTS